MHRVGEDGELFTTCERRIQASSAAISALTDSGSVSWAMSASVVTSSTWRSLARSATQVSRSRAAAPRYSMSSGACPATAPSGPSTARITSATVIRSAAGERVPAVGPAMADDEPGAPQLQQDVLEELLRDVLGLGEPLGGDVEPGPRAASSPSARIA